MALITVFDKDKNVLNFEYVKLSLSEVIIKTSARCEISHNGARQTFTFSCPDEYEQIARLEIADKLATSWRGM